MHFFHLLAAFLSLVHLGTAIAIRSAPSYSDDLARKRFWPLCAAAYTNPTKCIDKWLNAQLIRQLTLPCDEIFKNDTCSGYTAISPTLRVIALVFRGTTTDGQLFAEGVESLKPNQQLGKGYVDEYFYNGFMKLWNAGMKDDFLAQHSRYPNYDIYITGHSLGGAMSTIAVNYLSINYDIPTIYHMTFGEPRVGDSAFVEMHDARFGGTTGYSYRVVHQNDIVPHIPPQLFSYEHHKTEIWYDNDMKTADYKTCSMDESSFVLQKDILLVW
ncbi:unnamed protein product, partial [Mesorhabditis belari]|uniref:Fungal lipase-type domain-containing protein n=1 Tax=Mesorhabditis belari TaxID=2138241 RepID=A0AAF3EEW3_9BILA